jgi:hypothetical protein
MKSQRSVIKLPEILQVNVILQSTSADDVQRQQEQPVLNHQRRDLDWVEPI